MTGLLTWRNLIKLRQREAENKSWIYAAENNRRILWWSWGSIDCQGKGKKVMWRSKNSSVTFWWWLKTWCNLPNLLLRWWIRNFATHYLRLLGIWKSWNFLFGITLEQNCPKLHKIENFDCYFIRCVLALTISGILLDYAWLNGPTIVLCFLGSVDAQFRLIDCLLKCYFFRLPSRPWISEEHLCVLVYETPFLVPKSVLIKCRWDCYLLIGLSSSFLRSLVKIIRSLSHFGILNANREEDVYQLSLSILPKNTTKQSNSQMWAQGAIMLCLYYCVFLMFPYIFKMFLLVMLGKVTIVLLELSLCI